MKRVARIGGAAALAVALLVAGGIGLFRPTGDGAQARRTRRRAATADSLLAPAIGGSLEQTSRTSSRGCGCCRRTGGRSPRSAWHTSSRPASRPIPATTRRPRACCRRSLGLERQDNFAAMVGMAALAAARHDFAAALRWGERAKAINPYNGNVYGVIGDAQVELGRYEDAFATFQTMVDTRPGLASYARVSYARELMGDVAGAIQAMKAARDIAGTPADAAWAELPAGRALLQPGRPRGREGRVRTRRRNRRRTTCRRSPASRRSRGRADDLQEAIDGYVEVVSRYPAPEYVIALGDLYAAAGQPEQADRQYALVHAEEQLFRCERRQHRPGARAVRRGHGDPAGAVARRARRVGQATQRPRRRRPTRGRCTRTGGTARPRATRARRWPLGDRNALFAFHAGMIQLELGNEDGARRLLSDARSQRTRTSRSSTRPMARGRSRRSGGAA